MQFKKIYKLLKYKCNYDLAVAVIEFEENGRQSFETAYFLMKNDKIEGYFGNKLPAIIEYWDGFAHEVKLYDGCLKEQKLNPTKNAIFDIKKGIVFQSKDEIIITKNGFKTTSQEEVVTIKYYNKENCLCGIRTIPTSDVKRVNEEFAGTQFKTQKRSIIKTTKSFDKSGVLCFTKFKEIKNKSIEIK